MIKREQEWRNKGSGAVVIIEFVSDELVTVNVGGGLLPMLKIIFLQNYEQVD